MHKSRLTIKEFSKKLCVSTATVSRAYSSKGRISENTREMILEKANELGYRPNINARNLVSQRSDLLSFFYPSLIKGELDYFIAEILLGINEEVALKGMRLQVHPFSTSENADIEEYKNLILNGTAAGIIVLGGTKVADELIFLAIETGMPYVVVGDQVDSELESVSFDTGIGAEKAGRYLKKIGRIKPAFVCGLQDQNKLDGFRKGLGSISGSLVVDSGGPHLRDGSKAFERLRKNHSDVDSVFCANDTIAIGFIKAALSAGVHIPSEIAVIGCDDIKFARYHTPALTTIRIPEYEIGQVAVNKLLALAGFNDKTDVGDIFACELVIRESA